MIHVAGFLMETLNNHLEDFKDSLTEWTRRLEVFVVCENDTRPFGILKENLSLL